MEFEVVSRNFGTISTDVLKKFVNLAENYFPNQTLYNYAFQQSVNCEINHSLV